MLRAKRLSTEERGIAVLFTAITMVFIVPLIGLVVDAGILYTVKTKLQMAVDAGALAGARALSRGLDGPSQQASAKAVAKDYVLANFPNGYFNISAPTPPDPTIDESVSNQRSITVNASVSAPLYFMRWLGDQATTVSATATAVRRDVNVMIVMDRSGSLAQSGSCAPLKQAAVSFVNKFANGRDNVGLVTFATSSMVDFPAATNFLSASPAVPDILNSLTCNGGTNSAQGLWQGYTQLVALNQPNALNVMLFFTDGNPTAFTARFPILNSSSCTDKTAKTAVMTAGFLSTDPIHPVVNWGLFNQTAQPQPMASDQAIGPSSPAGTYANCAYSASWPISGQNIANDVQYIPSADIYGNAMNTNYQPVTYHDANGDINVDPVSIVSAAVNAADSAGLRIRQGAGVPGGGAGIPSVHVFSIGLGNAGGVPDDFLERVANDPRASNSDTSRVQGLYIFAPSAADLSDAFSRIASEILHLSK
jgi:Flp pilus assembly protein TadG